MEPELPLKVIDRRGSESAIQSKLVKKAMFASAPAIQSPLPQTITEIIEEQEEVVDLDGLTDDVLFPGYSFDTTRKYKNFVNNLDPFQQDNDLEQAVIEKYSKHGCLSVFKGKKEMHEFKQKILFKNHVKELYSRLEEKEREMGSALQDLEASKEQRKKADSEIQKIITELKEIFRAVDIPSPFDGNLDVTLPRDPRLMMQSRYRALVEQFGVHKSIYLENNARMVALEDRIYSLREQQQVLEQEESRVEPMLEQIDQEDNEQLYELGIVAKHRYIENEQKRTKLVQAQQLKEQKQAKLQLLKEKKAKLLEPIIQERNKRMNEFYVVSSTRAIDAPLKKPLVDLELIEKKQKAMAQLKEQLKKLQKKVGRKAKAKKPAIQETELMIEKEYQKAQQEKLKRKQAQEKKRMQIVERILNQERPVKPLIPIRSKSPEKTIKELEQQVEMPIIEQEPKTPIERKRVPIPLIKVKPVVNQVPLPTRSFEFDPPKVHFKDVVQGKTQTITVRAINMSGAPNSFKMLTVPDELEELITVHYQPPGKMASASDCTIQVRLQVNGSAWDAKRIESELEFVAQYGSPFQLPILLTPAECIPMVVMAGGSSFGQEDFEKEVDGDIKKPLPKLTCFAKKQENEISLDLGGCVLGDKKSVWLKLVNRGSIPTTVELKESALECIPKGDFVCHVFGSFVVKVPVKPLEGFGSCLVKVVFKPAHQLTSNQDDGSSEGIKEQLKQIECGLLFSNSTICYNIHCKAIERTLPFFPDRKLLDFQWCIGDMEYQDKLTLWNKYPKMSRKFWLDFGSSKTEINASSALIHTEDFERIEVSPISGFVQPNGSVPIWVKVKFSKDTAKRVQNESDGQVMFQFYVCFYDPSSDEPRKIPIKLKANLTTCDIVIQGEQGQQILEFGSCSIFERKELPIVIENTSKFPQLISCLENDIFKVTNGEDSNMIETAIPLEPLEKIQRLVRFEPTTGKEYNGHLRFKTTWNEVFEINCRGIGVVPPATFSCSNIVFDPISFGTSVSKSVGLKRTGNPTDDLGVSRKVYEKKSLYFKLMKPMLVEFMETAEKKDNENLAAEPVAPVVKEDGVPGSNTTSIQELSTDMIVPKELELSEKDLEFLQVWPTSGLLEANGNLPIQITVQLPQKPESPKKEEKIVEEPVVPIANGPKGKQDRKRKVSAKPVTQEEVIEPVAPVVQLSPFQQKLFSETNTGTKWMIPCVLEYKDTEKERIQSLLYDTPTEGISPTAQTMTKTIYLQVTVPVAPLDIQLVDLPLGKLDYQIVAANRKSIKQIVIQNTSNERIQLIHSGLSPMGPFELVKAIRPIEPGQKGIIQVAFMPEVGGKYFTTMDLSHGKSKISVHLIAEAIQPDIQIEPLKELYMGDVCIGDTSTQKVKIKNNNPIQINCEFSMISEVDASIVGRDHGSLNFSGKSPFVCAVKRLSIEPNAVVEVDVKFQPDRDHDNFFDRLLIKAECLDDPLCIILTGKGWDTSTCITNCDSHPSSYSATCFTLGPAKEYENALKRHQKTAEDVAKEEPSVKYLWTMNYKTKHFATVTIPWAKVKGSDLLEQYPALDPNKEYWRIPPAEVILANWKPLFKLEAGKKASLTEFTVEEYDGTFYYDNVLKDYMLIYKSAKTHPKNGFEIELEPAKGTIDLGTTKPLQIVTKDPTRILWNQCYEAWSKLESTKPEPAPLSTLKKTPGDYLSCSMEVDDSQAEEFKRMANEMELADPVYMERVFKIKFKNSYRFVEPKGPHPPNETRVFYLKVKVEPPV